MSMNWRNPFLPGIGGTRCMLALVTLLGVCWTLACLIHSHLPGGFEWVNHDVAFNLYAGRLIFEGRQLYIDRLDTNPPGILLLSGLVDWIARHLHMSSILLLHGATLFLGLVGLWMIQAMYARAKQVNGLMLVSLAYLLIMLGCGLPGNRSFTYSFAQKEHLFALVFIPYVLGLLIDTEQGLGPLFLSFLVGLFSSFKPQFFVLVLAVEGICFACDRRSRYRTWAVLSTGAMLPYLVLLIHSPPSFLAFFTEILPYYLNGSHAFYNQPYSAYLRSTPHHWLLLYFGFAASMFFLAIRTDLLSKRALLSMVLLPAIAYLFVVQQHKFWEYHSVIVVSLVLVFAFHSASLLLVNVSDRKRKPLFAFLLLVLTGQLMGAMFETRHMIQDWNNWAGTDPGTDILKAWPYLYERPRVLYYSTANVHMRIALYLNQQVLGKWGHDFIYPSIIHDPNPEQRRRLLENYCAEQAELIRTTHPDAIVFHSLSQALTSADQDMYNVLVRQCKVVPDEDYTALLTAVPRASLFLRRSRPQGNGI